MATFFFLNGLELSNLEPVQMNTPRGGGHFPIGPVGDVPTFRAKKLGTSLFICLLLHPSGPVGGGGIVPAATFVTRYMPTFQRTELEPEDKIEIICQNI